MSNINLNSFLFIVLVISSCNQPHRTPDTILYNGKIITIDSAFSLQQAVSIREGIILKVGTTDDVLGSAGDATRLIDLKGRVVIPGLIEGHAHPVAASQSEYRQPIPVVTSIEEVLSWIRKEAAVRDKDEWIVHPKFFITRMKDMRQISIQELDHAAPNNPVFLNGSYGGIVNTRALQISGMLTRRHPGILRDHKTDNPTGLIRRSAFGLLALPPPDTLTHEQKTTALRSLLEEYNRIGFTSIVSGGGSLDELELFEDLEKKGELTVRVFHNVRLPVDLNRSQEEVTEAVARLGMSTGDGNDWVKVGAFKVVLDGGMLTGTAFLHEGWGANAKDLYGISDPAYRGELMYSKEQLIKVITAAATNGWKFTAHVTGGGGVDTLLAAYRAVHAINPLTDRRFSIIHGNFFTADAISTMAELEIYADMQPAWYYKDADLLQHVLGSERMKTFHPYRSLVDGGVKINGGSDHMVKVDPDLAINPYNPFTAMWSVVTRKTDNDNVYNAGEAITREDALRMYTINNAYASFEENVKGSIEKGKFADLVVLSHDILTCPEDSIRKIRPVLTIVNGKTVYDTTRDDHP